MAATRCCDMLVAAASQEKVSTTTMLVEIGGAQALLQLGSKHKDGTEEGTGDESIGEEEEVVEEVEHEHGHEHGHELDDDNLVDDEDEVEKANNQQINDAVEAAVMRYVGGTLEAAHQTNNINNINKRNKRKLPDDIINNLNEFNQWTGFLDDSITEGSDFYSTTNRSPNKRKKRDSHSNGIDPELEGLGTSEHDQLVQAAINDARELAKHINQDQNHYGEDNNSSIQNSISAITQLANAATTLSRKPNAKGSSSSIRGNNNNNSINNINNNNNNNNQSDTNGKRVNNDFKPLAIKRKFNHLTNVETLVEEASAQACAWFNSLPNTQEKGPRKFSPEELSALDHFIEGYCHLNKWTREDVCNRIWSNERKKDNFWESLTRVLPYRSKASIYKHVKRQYHIFDVRAKWSPEDDALLQKLSLTHEGKWRLIGEAMGRMPEDCRDRWRNYVKCGDNRSSNKWSEEEENNLRNIVTEMTQTTKNGTINWTIVSERMNGTRSRIQCRYKWTKLLKKDASEKSVFMPSETRLWLLQQIKDVNYANMDEIDWEALGNLYKELPKDSNNLDDTMEWVASDFKTVFEKMRLEISNFRKMPLKQIITRLLDSNYKQMRIMRLAEEQLITKPPSTTTSTNTSTSNNHNHNNNNRLDPNDPESIANAAVAAVSSTVSADDVQHQEYSLWR
ncbi:uncharacterized protein RJT21DRAFT_131642 [Scheffersomyces amazonensis]|uniref:uncharacterized protein n=1 Tax=Scheffersomyces amazonensis TaxID=1078765 RepID=UPI00315CF25E